MVHVIDSAIGILRSYNTDITIIVYTYGHDTNWLPSVTANYKPSPTAAAALRTML